jgi:transcriptional regulator with XRE-family HTH domain
VLGPRLRLAREALGISEQEAVTIFRCTPRTFRKIEAGHSSPHVCALNDFCEKYNVSWVWLAGGDVPEDCAGLAPAQAIRRMAGLVAH